MTPAFVQSNNQTAAGEGPAVPTVSCALTDTPHVGYHSRRLAPFLTE